MPFQEQLLPDMLIPTTTKTPTAPQGYELVRPFLAATGRTIDKVLGDGNCLFRALAKQLSRNPDKYMELRGKL